MEQDREKYEKFYAAFGMQIKYGVLNDYGAKNWSLCRTCFFTGPTSRTSSSPSRNMWTPCPRSKSISTLQAAKIGRDLRSCRSLEKLGEKGFDVLLMTDEVDKLRTADRSESMPRRTSALFTQEEGSSAFLTEEEKKEAAEQAEKSKATLEFVKTTLGDDVKEVRLSENLGTHPVCMVPERGYDV